jgi:clan AA aspartic protease (TIGR02281 family)
VDGFAGARRPLRKAFFYETKSQEPVARVGGQPVSPRQLTNVFWFFFSKKNILPALLSACATPPPPAAPQLCRLDRIADLPMAPGFPTPIVLARIDGQPVTMLVDTGDERLTVRRNAMAALHLAEDPTHRTAVHGVGGTVTSNDAIIQSFELGGVELPQSGAAVADLAGAPNLRPPLAGIIGGQTLADYDVEFNFAARKLVLWQRAGCESVVPDWPPPYATARLARGAANLMTLDVSINGVAVRALLDTGATNTVLSPAAAGRIGITQADLSAARTSVSRGADGNDIFNRVYRTRDVAIGPLHEPNLPVLVGPVRVPFAEMLLGVDFLRHRDLWLSYSGQLVFVR